MAFQKLQIVNAECIAPDSENTMIPESTVTKLSKRYKSLIVLFDNDEPGIKAAERYKLKYGFNYVTLVMEKDLSDSIEKHGVDKTRGMLLPLLKQAL
jgi:DNA primase